MTMMQLVKVKFCYIFVFKRLVIKWQKQNKDFKK